MTVLHRLMLLMLSLGMLPALGGGQLILLVRGMLLLCRRLILSKLGLLDPTVLHLLLWLLLLVVMVLLVHGKRLRLRPPRLGFVWR